MSKLRNLFEGIPPLKPEPDQQPRSAEVERERRNEQMKRDFEKAWKRQQREKGRDEELAPWEDQHKED